MNIKIEIKHWITGSILFEFEKENNTVKDTVIEAVKKRAYLRGANLRGADLRGADLRGADLRGADLREAYLRGAKGMELCIAQTRILPDGDIIGWKKCLNNIIVKLLIPKEAKRLHAFGRKCRAEFADVVEIIGSDKAYSTKDNKFCYEVGKRVFPTDPFNEDFTNECSSGIHFFITKLEAENY